MKRTAMFLSMAMLMLIVPRTEAWAQATAQISGSVRDQSNAVLPGVEITATQTETGLVRTAVTNETGSYILQNLPLGPYRLEASLPGFRTFAQTGIVLQVNGNPEVNPVLEVGQVAETVEVQANATMVETRSAGVGQVMENQRILELPLNGRQVTDLITLSGAAVQTGASRDNNYGGSAYISVGGGLGFGVAYTLDGANHMNFITSGNMPMPFPDALQEFKVETSGLSAQHGKETAVNSVTKSGTNDFHGGLFEFVRNDLFNARNYFATKGSTLKRNQFGGTVGGPIVRNKLFFFAGYQQTTLREDPADIRAFLPTAAVLAGDWTAFNSPACNAGRTVALRAPFTDNRISPSQYSPAALNLIRRINQIGPGDCGEVTFGRRNVRDEGQLVLKFDYQMSDRHSLFARFLVSPQDIKVPFSFSPNNLLTTTTTGQDNLATSYALGSTYLITPNVVNSFRLSANRVRANVLGPKVFSPCDIGVNTYCGYAPESISISVTGAFAVGARFIPKGDHWTGTSYQFSDDVSVVRGSHQFAFGVNALQGRHVENYLWFHIGQVLFNGQATGSALADFLTGRVGQLTTAGPVNHALTHNIFALYASDTWKATSRFTLNYGLRWDPYLPQKMTNGRAYHFDYDKFKQGVKSVVFKNAPAGFTYIGDPGFPDQSGINKRWAQFAPRAGFAWATDDSSTSVRASYAYGYDFIAALWREDYSSAAPWTNATVTTGVSYDDPWAGFPGGNPFPIVSGADARFSPFTNFQSVPFDVKTPTTSSWNLNLQRQIGTDWLASASYIGTQAVHVWAQQPLNPAIYSAAASCVINGVNYAPCSTLQNTNQRRKLNLERPQDGQFIGALSVVDDGGTQSYNGMLLSLQRRATRGVTVTGNYTWSHCIGDYADINSGGPDANETYTVTDNRDADRGNCAGDRRHILNVTSVASTPEFTNTTARILASGWRLAGIYRWSTGSPLTVIAGSDRALNSIANQRANQVLENPYGDKSAGPLSNYLNPAAFALPAVGTVGNLGRNSLVGPSTWAFDLALSRSFNVTEGQRLEFRAEAYNITNSFRPSFGAASASLPNVSLASATFSQIRTALDPRILQFALKYVF